ncbi:3-methyladenine DNA glycosylase [Diatrype stigma]|uniref:3-methyladenine DNA glycosylase n=1 Tax=Diatrype stigma TaxID=117547 RepID=A0AAN9UML1_9PEZI
MSTSARLSAAAATVGKLSSQAPAAATAATPAKKATRKRKATATSEDLSIEGGEAKGDTAPAPAPAPTTPSRKRRAKATQEPATPTPSNAKLMAEPAATGHAPATTPKPKPAAVRRLADANRTNAALLSPETSRVVMRKAATASAAESPSKAPPAANLLEEACAHLIRVDPRMRPLIEAHRCRIFSPEGLAEQVDPFESLCSGIISQQVSGAAARSIKKRFVELFFPPSPSTASPEANGDEDADKDKEDGKKEQGQEQRKEEGDFADATAAINKTEEESKAGNSAATTTTTKPRIFPQPSQVAACPLERLRTAGLSQRKAEYVQGLAEHFVSGALSTELLADAPYEEVMERLTAVRGLGLWSAEMFACFALKRLDVFSLGDLGVQRGMAAFVGRDVAKLKAKGKGGGKWKYMSEQDMRELSDRFAPYRSLFMWYMWRVEETDISSLE